jgi:hypothetical protein
VNHWFAGNPIGIALAASCGVLAITSMLLAMVWTLPPSATGGDADAEPEALSVTVAELEESEPLAAYAVIIERPVFNEGRRPLVGDDEQDDAQDGALADEDIDVDAPKLELFGVVLTPSIRMVTLRHKDHPESLVAFEGQPLEGDYGSWHVRSIREREVTLASGSGEELQLVLQVHDVKIEEPPELEVESAAEDPAADDEQPLSRAEEIRQRIAQRREELRAAAQEQEQAESKPVDYRSAVQSMINGGSRKKEEDEGRQ